MVETYYLAPLSYSEISSLGSAAAGYIDHIYLHWSAGNYGQAYEDYHICIDDNGKMYDMSNGDLTERKAHTWHRNSNAIGIAMLCCAGGECNSGPDADYGSEPPTDAQIESMAKCVAALCTSLGIEISPETVMTHCEAAVIDGYGPGSGDPETRWDLWYLPQSGEQTGGEYIRGKAIWYQQHAE